ncbi:alpha-hydroxy acid oxidase [Kineococcus sp. SYSU DK004]|uniref:alpha-hydroxy acid oxidase n=1 Tax=Kineococcus sp. SYSU DK004 TaxID=3383125 RepID=UPI003D7E5236
MTDTTTRPLSETPPTGVPHVDPSGPALTEAPLNVHELRAAALQRMREGAFGQEMWDYLEGGSGDERSLRWNEEAWGEIRLAPRCLVGVDAIDTSVELFGSRVASPIGLSPAASHRIWHDDGELGVVDAANEAGMVYCQSTLGTASMEDVAARATGPLWFQLYVRRDRELTASLALRAAAAGYQALVVTVDTPVLGARDTDRRRSVRLPAGLSFANLPAQTARVEDPLPAHRRVYVERLDPTLTWKDITWLAELTDLPVVVKGVLRADDASRALDHGARGVWVSNHGARNLDTVVPTAQALPAVAAEVAGRVPVVVDSGVRRGTDVLKALCLGADAVFVGRPYLYGLAAAGREGALAALHMLDTELRMAMGLCGAPRLADLGPDLLWH